MREVRVKANQIELQVREYEEKGNAIIFLHFSGANLMMWQRSIPYFQDKYLLILVDLRGHGKSDKPQTGYHMDEMAKDVAGIFQNLKIERAHIIGSSLGAEVGLSLAANYPDKVISLVCDGALSSEFGPYGTWDGSETEFQEHVAGQLEKMRNAPEKIFPTVEALVDNSQEALEKFGYWNEYVEEVERYGAYRIGEGQYTKSFRKPARIDYMKNYFQYRLEDYYAKLKCPVLMLPGEDLLQNERDRAAMEGLSKLARRAQVIEVKGWDHPYGWLMDPGAVCKTIFEFLRDTPD
jgi:2-succinyl-6-hydroxy-2,4-cyclohexadiene-1-carboxylate synthase